MRWLFFIVTLLTLAAGISLPFYIAWPSVAVPEAILLLLLICLIILRITTIRPLMAVRTGVSLLNEQDFSSRLTHVGQRDA